MTIESLRQYVALLTGAGEPVATRASYDALPRYDKAAALSLPS